MSAVKSRREEYSDATRHALLESAAELFGEAGYAGTSIDDIAGAARLTKGALYHHFKGKPELFEAVYERSCEALMDRVTEAVRSAEEPWDRALRGLSTYLSACAEPRTQRIVLQDAPAVFGWTCWREKKDSHGEILTQVLGALMAEGEIDRLPSTTLSGVLLAAIGEGAMLIAQADDQGRARAEVEEVLLRLLEGLRPRFPD